MKVGTSLFFILFPVVLFSQALHYGSGGTVYDANNQKLRPESVRALLSKNAEALTLYNTARDKKTWGNVLFYGGLGLIATNVVVAANKDETSNSSNPSSVKSERSSPTLAIIGGALMVISIPVKIGYPKKIKAAIADYNKGVTSYYKPSPSVSIVASIHQMGLKVQF